MYMINKEDKGNHSVDYIKEKKIIINIVAKKIIVIEDIAKRYLSIKNSS